MVNKKMVKTTILVEIDIKQMENRKNQCRTFGNGDQQFTSNSIETTIPYMFKEIVKENFMM